MAKRMSSLSKCCLATQKNQVPCQKKLQHFGPESKGAICSTGVCQQFRNITPTIAFLWTRHHSSKNVCPERCLGPDQWGGGKCYLSYSEYFDVHVHRLQQTYLGGWGLFGPSGDVSCINQLLRINMYHCGLWDNTGGCQQLSLPKSTSLHRHEEYFAN